MFNPILKYYGKLNNNLFIEAFVEKETHTFQKINLAGNIPHTEPTKVEYIVTKEEPEHEGTHYVLTISKHLEIRHHLYEDFDHYILDSAFDHYYIIEK